ncbi:beta-phosphoglucomutase [Halobacillus ihumii]|uniref:beta-phosphoglucomutase n=1 Tax=Halobacillus ihumii TaxID=2686092 RepID=UPI0013D51B43|nr:beta-phosphoglucomutase [Halobacillus ihumii]
MNSQHIEAVVFDLDGVITDTAHYHYLAWKQLADELGIPFDESFNENLKGVSRVDSLKLILAHGNQSDAYTDSEIEDLASQKNEFYKQLIQQLTPEDILPGIKELIEEIRSESIPVGLASVSKNAKTVLHALEIEHLFDYCADAAKIKQSKPDPEIFLTECEALGADPKHSIGVEDAKVGVQSIQASSMFAVGVGSYLDQADLMVNDTTELSWKQIKRAYLHQ